MVRKLLLAVFCLTTAVAFIWGFAYAMWDWSPTDHPSRLVIWLWATAFTSGCAVTYPGWEVEDG